MYVNQKIMKLNYKNDKNAFLKNKFYQNLTQLLNYLAFISKYQVIYLFFGSFEVFFHGVVIFNTLPDTGVINQKRVNDEEDYDLPR